MNPSSVTRGKRLAIAAVATIVGLTPSAAMAVSCSVSTLSTDFGLYNPLSAAPLSTTGSINIACTCTNILDCVAFGYRIDVSAGQSGNTAAREMRAGTGRLLYNLYSDPGYNSVWGTGNAGSSMLYLVTLFGTRQTATVYARVPARQAVPAGNYSDTPIITIVY